MKRRLNRRKLTTVIILLSLILGCENDFSTPNVACSPPEIQANTTLKNVKDMYVFGGKTFEDELIVEGYVSSSDFSGNIYKTIFIQDQPEDPTTGIKVAIDQTFNHTKYPLGRKIYLNLKGLSIDYYFGSLQIGKFYDNDFQGIDRNQLSNHLIRTCENATIIPKKITLNSLDENDVGLLVEIRNAQFNEAENGQSYANLDNNDTVSRQIDQYDDDCGLLGSTELKNSGFADFKSRLLPTGSGSIVGLLDNYYDDFQLIIRDIEDVEMNNPRCGEASQLSPTITLKKVLESYQGEIYRFGVSEELIVEAFVISTDEYGNFQKRLIVQDATENPTAGIQILIDKENLFEDFSVGDRVLVKLNKLYMDEVEGRLSIGFGGNELDDISEEEVYNHIINSKENFAITPLEITIDEVKSTENQQILLSVLDLQSIKGEENESFTVDSGNEDGVRTFETCGKPNRLPLFTSEDALFANDLIPTGSGKITGIFSGNQLEIRNKDDLMFAGSYVACPELEFNIFFTEIADPKNSTSARFIELYNASNFSIELNNWKINKYLNDSNSPSGTGLDLSGHTIPQNGFLVIANTGFQAIFNTSPDIETSFISGNGDDSYELVDPQENKIDVYGVIGEDGSGKKWEYENGKAIRKPSISKPNSKFETSEWLIYTENNNMLTDFPDSPQEAPDDFGPGVR